ncbi:MAG: GntR family transcriptional regulator [Pseudomonadota bacterium]
MKPRQPLGDEVHQIIKSAILRGELKPGQRLIEAQLAAQLGASRTPVRQAMHILEREGLAMRLNRGGLVVRPLSMKDVQEILDLRCVLESFAARKAAENITPETLALLERRNENFGRAIDKGDHEHLAGLNTEFHETLYSLAQSPRLERLIQDLHDHFYRYRITLLKLKDMAQTSYRDHKQMIRAMAEGDPDRTEQLVREHILRGKAVIMAEAEAGRLEL